MPGEIADAAATDRTPFEETRRWIDQKPDPAMTDVLLVQPPIRDFYLTTKRTIPYGLASIAAALEAKGFSVRIIDALATSRSRPAEIPESLSDLKMFYGPSDVSPFGLFSGFRHFGYSFEHLARLIRNDRPFMIGISSLFTPYETEALNIADMVRSVLPGCPVVLGGHHPTHFPERVLSHPGVDFVLRGEGEVSMPVLAEALRRGQAVESIPGICFRKPEGEFIINAPAFVSSAEDFPPPAFHLLQNTYYQRKQSGSCVIVTSRGCPMNCSYCCTGRSSSIPYRRRSVASVMEEIDKACETGEIGFIDFEDENLSLDRSWFLSLLRDLEHRFTEKSVELRAMNGLFPSTLDEEVVFAMRAAGFRTLNLSLGSTSPEQLARFRRPDVIADFDRCLSLAERYGMTCVGYIIAGAPHQRPEDSVADLLYLAKRRVLAGLSVFYPAPGSADYEKCRKMNILPGSMERMRSSALPVSHVTARRDLVTLMRIARILNFMKSLLDAGEPLPVPASPSTEPTTISPDRKAVGCLLLSWFLRDGGIRGHSQTGEIFEHKINTKLTRLFLTGLKNGSLAGFRAPRSVL